MTEKACTKCDRVQPLANFYRRAELTSGRVSHCKQCHTGRYLERKRAGYVLSKYGISLEDYTTRLALGCAICARKAPEVVMHMDHDHATGALREALCTDCNLGLGRFQDDTATMRAAIDYLERHA